MFGTENDATIAALVTGGGTYQPSQSNAIASLLKNLVHRAGVQEPVTLSIDNVEAPLLTSDKGDVVTLLNHHALGAVLVSLLVVDSLFGVLPVNHLEFIIYLLSVVMETK